MNKIEEITDGNFDRIITENRKPVLVEFYAPWCGHCKMQAPIIKELADLSGEKYLIGQINIDDNQRKALEYSITGVPSFLVFKDGKVVDHKSGARNLEELKSLVERYV